MISLIKLTNGTEIIGDIINQENETVTVRDPLQINYRQRMDMAPPTVFLHRFIPFAMNTDHTIRDDHVLSYSVPLPGLVVYYAATLNAIKTSVDTSVDNELQEAAKFYNEDEEEEVKRAMFEKASRKPILN